MGEREISLGRALAIGAIQVACAAGAAVAGYQLFGASAGFLGLFVGATTGALLAEPLQRQVR